MTKLKTLKDLIHYNINDIRNEDFLGIALKRSYKNIVKVETFPIFIFEQHLREEAIKWVKYGNSSQMPKGGFEILLAEKWIKHFFNLTEEDLK